MLRFALGSAVVLVGCHGKSGTHGSLSGSSGGAATSSLSSSSGGASSSPSATSSASTSGSAVTGASAGSTSASSSSGSAQIDAGYYPLRILAPAAPAGACDVHAEQPSSFTDATDAWGLGDGGLGMTGNRIMSADLDSDGYPDVIVEALASNERETVPVVDDGGYHLADGGKWTRLVTVLMNRPRPDGGRCFVDATQATGLFAVPGSPDQYRSAQIAVAGDVDNNGTVDLFSGTYIDGNHPETDPGDRSQVMLNDGHGNFTAAPDSALHDDQQNTWATSGASFLDTDHDGRLDLFEAFWYMNYGYGYASQGAQLYLGHGDGTFSNATLDAGLYTDSTGSQASLQAGTDSRPAYGVTTCDLNGDGYPELMITAYGRQWNMLYENLTDGGFVQNLQDGGYGGDLDRNYDDNQEFVCYCTQYPTAVPCLGITAMPQIQCPTPAGAAWDDVNDELPWRLNGNGFTTVCRDFDGDGKPDLYTANIRHWYVGESSDPSQLLQNVTPSDGGPVTFERRANIATNLVVPHQEVAWDEGLVQAADADLDNDGRPDLFVAATDYDYQFGLMYIQQPDGTFVDQAQSWGLHHACTNGLTIADFDRDGDLDVLVGSSTARTCAAPLSTPGGGGWTAQYVHLYTNNASEHGHWLALRLRGDGVTTNTMGIGARVTVTVNGVAQVQEVLSGYGNFGMGNDTGVLFFGLGACPSIDQLEVRWPNKVLSVDTYHHVPANTFVELHQGDPTLYGVVLPN